MRKTPSHAHLIFALALLLSACGDSTSGPDRTAPPTFRITGTAGAPQASVLLTGDTTLTVTADGAGTFTFPAVHAGAYRVAPTLAGSVFQPVEANVVVTNVDVTGLTFAPAVAEEGIDAATLALIDAEPDTWMAPEDVILPNGRTLAEYAAEREFQQGGILLQHLRGDPTGPQQRKNDIVARMLLSAQDMACGRNNPPCTKWDFAADASDPATMPAQTGLTYVYGGKTPAVRTLPVDGCPERTHGVDCSGLVSVAATAAGIQAPAGSAAQSVASNWVFPEEWQLEMKVVTDGTIESGDILYWPGHIGVAQAGGGVTVVISATGQSAQCAKNIAPPRGPRPLTIAGLRMGQPTTVLRLVTTLSGDFDMFIRCATQSTDAAVIRFTIDNDNGGPFNSVGTGTDYNGAPLSFTLQGSYDQISNVVEATLSTNGANRVDSFSQRLNEDDTGYFPLTKVVDNGGCAAAVRLLRIPLGSEGGPAAPNTLIQPGPRMVPAHMKTGR